MNKLHEEVCRILDFAPQYLSIAINEATNKEKLLNTYMLVNGELRYISAFGWANGSVSTYDGVTDTTKEIEIESLEPWLPLSGLYISENQAVYLYKLTHKHWQKSFNAKHYSLEPLVTFFNANSDLEKALQMMSKTTPVPMGVVKNYLYYGKKKIATIKGDVVDCIFPHFYQEILDYSNRRRLNWIIQ